MSLPKRYHAQAEESRLQEFWQEAGVYHFCATEEGPVYSIDTPPPTVSGHLHLGHVYSYSQADFLARFWRMNGHRVFYPMGYDDNGLPTEQLVERALGIRAGAMEREVFIKKCLEFGAEAAKEYQVLWQRLGLSVDWRYSYRTISAAARRISQWSFLDLYRRDLVYRQEAPIIWCPTCATAIAQAELEDLERQSTFFELDFQLPHGAVLPIATTRPELLPACAAVFVHPQDSRFSQWVGNRARVPLSGQEVPILADAAVDPDKGTGAVMCCTFGDATDVAWWRQHKLPLKIVIDAEGCMNQEAGEWAGLPVLEARQRLVQALDQQGLLRGSHPLAQTVRLHERCDTPVEYRVSPQWFVRVLDFKEQLLAAGEAIDWCPAHMKTRYQQWVEGLSWDWCISRQRYFGVQIPLWYCSSCGAVNPATEEQLPVDPLAQEPGRACPCGNATFAAETDVMDTWATSALTPQIAGRFLAEEDLYTQVFPMSMRSLGHEIIRTWAFYALVKSLHHFGTPPWKKLVVSGWGLAPAGQGKISKSRGGGPLPPAQMLKKYPADALRYWAASTGPGKDALINEEKMAAGAKLVNKLWNLSRFAQRFLEGYRPAAAPQLSPADAWILSRTQNLVRRSSDYFSACDYAMAKSETEVFFWRELADNYLEMAKKRLYDETCHFHAGARYTLHQVLLTTLKLLAPFLPHVTEAVFLELFAASAQCPSIHRSPWPRVDNTLVDQDAEDAGQILLEVATAVRRYKSERDLPLGTELQQLHLWVKNATLATRLQPAAADIASITRAQQVYLNEEFGPGLEGIEMGEGMRLAVRR